MGNYNFRANNPSRGEIVMIKQSKFTADKEMDGRVLKEGSKAKVVQSGTLMKSRPNAPDIHYTTVMFPNGEMDAYPTVNIQRKG